MKNDLPSKIKRGKPTFIRIKANKKGNEIQQRQRKAAGPPFGGRPCIRPAPRRRIRRTIHDNTHGRRLRHPAQFRLGRARKHLYPLRPTRPQARLHRPLSGGVFLCDWEYPCRTRTILHELFLHRFDMPGTDRSFAGRTDARPPVADGKIHTGTSDRRGKICGKVIPPYGNHPATRGGVQWKMQTDTIKGKDAPSPFPIQKIYSSTLPALFPQAVSGATGPIHRCLQRS